MKPPPRLYNLNSWTPSTWTDHRVLQNPPVFSRLASMAPSREGARPAVHHGFTQPAGTSTAKETGEALFLLEDELGLAQKCLEKVQLSPLNGGLMVIYHWTLEGFMVHNGTFPLVSGITWWFTTTKRSPRTNEQKIYLRTLSYGQKNIYVINRILACPNWSWPWSLEYFNYFVDLPVSLGERTWWS